MNSKFFNYWIFCYIGAVAAFIAFSLSLYYILNNLEFCSHVQVEVYDENGLEFCGKDVVIPLRSQEGDEIGQIKAKYMDSSGKNFFFGEVILRGEESYKFKADVINVRN